MNWRKIAKKIALIFARMSWHNLFPRLRSWIKRCQPLYNSALAILALPIKAFNYLTNYVADSNSLFGTLKMLIAKAMVVATLGFIILCGTWSFYILMIAPTGYDYLKYIVWWIFLSSGFACAGWVDYAKKRANIESHR